MEISSLARTDVIAGDSLADKDGDDPGEPGEGQEDPSCHQLTEEQKERQPQCPDIRERVRDR